MKTTTIPSSEERLSDIIARASGQEKTLLELLLKTYALAIKQALKYAVQQALISEEVFQSIVSNLEARIYDFPNSESYELGAYDLERDRWYLNTRFFLNLLTKALSIQNKLTRAAKLRLTQLLLQLTAYHEVGHWLLAKLEIPRVTSFKEAVLHEAFAEFYAWKVAIAVHGKELKVYLHEAMFPQERAKLREQLATWKSFFSLYLSGRDPFLESHLKALKALRETLEDEQALQDSEKLQAILKALELDASEKLFFLLTSKHPESLSMSLSLLEQAKESSLDEEVPGSIRKPLLQELYTSYLQLLSELCKLLRVQRLTRKEILLKKLEKLLDAWGYKALVEIPVLREGLEDRELLRLPPLAHIIARLLAMHWIERDLSVQRVLASLRAWKSKATLEFLSLALVLEG